MPLFNLNQNQQVIIPLPLPVELGGTGNSTLNLVDLSSDQTIEGNKIFEDFVTLGDNLPIKIRKVEATTAADQGGLTAAPHGLIGDRVVGIVGIVRLGDNGFVGTNYLYSAGYQFDLSANGENIFFLNSAENSANILNKPAVAIVFYTS